VQQQGVVAPDYSAAAGCCSTRYSAAAGCRSTRYSAAAGCRSTRYSAAAGVTLALQRCRSRVQAKVQAKVQAAMPRQASPCAVQHDGAVQAAVAVWAHAASLIIAMVQQRCKGAWRGIVQCTSSSRRQACVHSGCTGAMRRSGNKQAAAGRQGCTPADLNERKA
jgi:hypothetical protein